MKFPKYDGRIGLYEVSKSRHSEIMIGDLVFKLHRIAMISQSNHSNQWHAHHSFTMFHQFDQQLKQPDQIGETWRNYMRSGVFHQCCSWWAFFSPDLEIKYLGAPEAVFYRSWGCVALPGDSRSAGVENPVGKSLRVVSVFEWWEI